ncbi:hypothetical protein GGF46_000936 [Coemansia sp. RSA 552]|nr:hypothetical protein GGF46_000936 [Coemansia sp. RSA 552]
MTARKEILDVTPAEWKMIANTVTEMKNRGWVRHFSQIHTVYFDDIHESSMFMPFHRRFLRTYELVGQRINPGFFIPYWDEYRDYRHTASSKVLSSQYLGGSGVDGCVNDGFQAGWMVDYPEPHCLKRAFRNNGTMPSWYSQPYILSLMRRSSTMAALRDRIENTQHAVTHVFMGGDMFHPFSPNDFAFMVHHAFIDRVWAEWQAQDNQNTFDGPDGKGQEMTLSSPIVYLNATVGSVMQMGCGDMCFEYAESPASASSTGRMLSALGALPDGVRAKWFPKTPGHPGTGSDTSSRLQLPQPGDIADDLVAFGSTDRAEAERLRAEAREFVRAMNAAGYHPNM